LCHGGGAARAISFAAGKKLEVECNELILRFGSVKVGKVMCTTAGNLKPRIQHVIYAVGPNVHDSNKNRQYNFDLVQSTVLCSLEYAEHVLSAASIAVLAISSGIFGVPKIDVAQALYEAILKFDETKPRFMKTVQLVNLDREPTHLINKEFQWRFGGVPDWCVSTECKTTISKDLVSNDEDGNKGTTIEGDSLLVRRGRKKECIPEKFTYFWGAESPFSQRFMCEFVIDGRLYNCSEKGMMQQKSVVFGRLELAERIMLMEDPKAMKRATQSKGIPTFDPDIWDRYSYGIVHDGNMHKFS